MSRLPKTEPPTDPVTAREFWQQVHTTFDWDKRIALMTQQIKFDPQARDKDPQAYDRLTEQRAAQAADTPAPAMAHG